MVRTREQSFPNHIHCSQRSPVKFCSINYFYPVCTFFIAFAAMCGHLMESTLPPTYLVLGSDVIPPKKKSPHPLSSRSQFDPMVHSRCVSLFAPARERFAECVFVHKRVLSPLDWWTCATELLHWMFVQICVNNFARKCDHFTML